MEDLSHSVHVVQYVNSYENLEFGDCEADGIFVVS